MSWLKLSDGASLMHILLWIHTNILGIGTILTFDYDRLFRKGRTGNCNTLKGKEYNGQISNLNFWLGTRNIMEIRIYIGTKNEKSFIKFEKLTEFTELVLECIVWGPESEDMSTFSPMNKCTYFETHVSQLASSKEMVSKQYAVPICAHLFYLLFINKSYTRTTHTMYKNRIQ